MSKTLALLLVSAFSTGASAAMVTVDAGHYSFSYDDSFWGAGSFSQSGDLFTFSNLVNNLGTSITSASDHPYIDKSNNFSARDVWTPAITITADAGYRVKSVLSGGTGSLTGVAAADPLNVQGSVATAFVSTSTQWFKENGGLSDEGGSFSNAFYQQDRNSLGDLDNTVGTPGPFNMLTTKGFSNGVTSLTGRFSSAGWAQAAGKGSWATALLDTAYYSVEVASITPVPEPETWAMFLAGLGVLGGVARRRKPGKA